MGELEDLNFVDSRATTFKCMDGRTKGKQLYTPGGDAGEFILSLFVYEKMIRKLEYEDVEKFLKDYLLYMK